MPVRKATPEETLQLFGNAQILFGQKRPTSSAQNSEPPTSGVTFPATRQRWDLQNLPEDPALGAMRAGERAEAAAEITSEKQPKGSK